MATRRAPKPQPKPPGKPAAARKSKRQKELETKGLPPGLAQKIADSKRR